MGLVSLQLSPTSLFVLAPCVYVFVTRKKYSFILSSFLSVRQTMVTVGPTNTIGN